MYTIANLIEQSGHQLKLELLAGKGGLHRRIAVPEAHCPGLALSGYGKHHKEKRLVVLGRSEIAYLKELDKVAFLERLQLLFTSKTPAIIVAERCAASKELMKFCDDRDLPLFRTSMEALLFLNRLSFFLAEVFAPMTTCHGTLVAAFGIGVLIQGDSSVGKSEAALGLIEKGHRLICDDVVKVRVREGYLEGSGPEMGRHLIEIRGIGIINVAHLYGAACVQDRKSVDLIVKLEEWDDQSFYDRVGLDEKFCDLLRVKVPYYILPVKPGRDVVLLIETLVLNHCLKRRGHHSAQELNKKLLERLTTKDSFGQTDTKATD